MKFFKTDCGRSLLRQRQLPGTSFNWNFQLQKQIKENMMYSTLLSLQAITPESPNETRSSSNCGCR